MLSGTPRLMRTAGLRARVVRVYRANPALHRFYEQHPNRLLNAAVRRRQPHPGLIFHSDRGSEYVAELLRDRLVQLGIRQSAAQRGPEDNPHVESFFHSFIP